MLHVFSELEAKYPHLGEGFSDDADKMVAFLEKGLALNAQEGLDGLKLGVDIAGMLLFLTVRTCTTAQGLPALHYLRRYYGTEGAPEDLENYLAKYLVEYLPYLAELISISRAGMEEYFRDARQIVEGSSTPMELFEIYQLRALRTMGREKEANERARTWREKGWNFDKAECESCIRTQKIWVAMAYEDLEQAQELAEDWLSGELKGCSRGPQDVLAELALQSFLNGQVEQAAVYARMQEKILTDLSNMFNWLAVIPLFEYYVAVGDKEAAQRWLEKLAPRILKSTFTVQRLRYLKAMIQLLKQYQLSGKTSIPFPSKVLPLSPEANGQLAIKELSCWCEEEATAIEKAVETRNQS